MNSREWFILGIRLFGVWQLTQGVANLASYAYLQFHSANWPNPSEPIGYVLYAAFDFALAAYFLFGAPHLAACCEPRVERMSDEKTDDNPST